MVQRHENRLIDLPDIDHGLIAAISDTHGKPHASLFPVLGQYKPLLILHAGDMGDRELLGDLEEVGPTIFVRGNVDPAGPGYPESVSVRIKLGRTFSLDILLLHIAIGRMRLNRDAVDLLQQYPAKVVVFGPSHIPFVGEDRDVWLFNPGSAGPSRMGLPTTIGFMEISPGQMSFKHIDLLTGRQWVPRGNS